MELFRKIKTSDRLPGIYGIYITDVGELPFDEEQQWWWDVSIKAFSPESKPEYWLEEIPEVSVEKAVSEIIGDKLSNKNRVIPAHYVRATFEYLKLIYGEE